jgi:hypothetical protein
MVYKFATLEALIAYLKQWCGNNPISALAFTSRQVRAEVLPIWYEPKWRGWVGTLSELERWGFATWLDQIEDTGSGGRVKISFSLEKRPGRVPSVPCCSSKPPLSATTSEPSQATSSLTCQSTCQHPYQFPFMPARGKQQLRFGVY